jgi:hypothetical protein
MAFCSIKAGGSAAGGKDYLCLSRDHLTRTHNNPTGLHES